MQRTPLVPALRRATLTALALATVACGATKAFNDKYYPPAVPGPPIWEGPLEAIHPWGWPVFRADARPPRPGPHVLPRPELAPSKPKPARPDLAFEPSDRDRATFGVGLTGGRAAPKDSGYGKGLGLVVYGDAPLAKAGLKTGDLLLAVGDIRFAADDDDPVGTFRDGVGALRPETDVEVAYFRKGEGVKRATATLGRAPPSFAIYDTPGYWMQPPWGTVGEDPVSEDMDAWIAAALSLDDGAARYADTIARNRKRMSRSDWFRMADSVAVHLNPSAQEPTARRITDKLAMSPLYAAYVAAGYPIGYVHVPGFEPGPDGPTVAGCVDALEAFLAPRYETLRTRLANWSDEDRKFLVEGFPKLTERMAMGEYMNGDEDVARERTNRRVIALLSQVDRTVLLEEAEAIIAYLKSFLPALAAAAATERKPGLILGKDTPFGRIEVWGSGNQRHGKRCVFRFDLEGDDAYTDVGGRADPSHPLSIQVDMSGRDIYGATSTFGQGAALGGIGILLDLQGDDQYLATQWSQGVGVAGFGLLVDARGNDTYRGNEMCTGLGLAGSGVVLDLDGRDTYTGDRYCQGVGLGGGVGAVVDKSGDDRYACTGRYLGEYGDAGVFSGWGQGVGFGFRHITSGGIGVLYDQCGNDVYEAGNFSQGGGYFYAWGILRDDKGDDRYIGSRYAQGFAAHQAQGTFLELKGDDVYQSHWGVAQGLSWDETTVVFHDYEGDDKYQSRGFSRAAAAHNGIAVFLDDAGIDTYETLPGQARSNTYHGGNSFSLFLDRGGDLDVYSGKDSFKWNDRVAWKHQGAYHLDLPAELDDLQNYVRPPETDEPKKP